MCAYRGGFGKDDRKRESVPVQRTNRTLRIITDSIKIFLIFCALRIVMITNGFGFMRIPVLDHALSYPIHWLESATMDLQKFWGKYR